jgi:hypothetical protein
VCPPKKKRERERERERGEEENCWHLHKAFPTTGIQPPQDIVVLEKRLQRGTAGGAIQEVEEGFRGRRVPAGVDRGDEEELRGREGGREGGWGGGRKKTG